jgi:UPF0755 protein
MNLIRNVFLGALLLTVIFCGAAYKFYKDFAEKPLSSERGEMLVDVPPNSNFFSVRSSLSAQGMVIDRFAFRIWAWAKGAEKKLRVGEYRIQKNWSAMRVMDELISGQALMHKIIIKEGHNIFDVAATFRETSFAQKNTEGSFENLIRDPALLSRLEVPAGSKPRTLEGFLFPETYSYQKYDSPRKLIEAMLEQFQKRALPILKSHPWGETAEGRYRLLTLASIVEKESGVVEEQPIIAGVFWNRINKKMKLQSDPTTIYALFPDFDGNLKRIHLTTPSDYNTYTLPELPYGPIANPGETALRAVVEPAKTDYFYFVGKGDGTHTFSVDYKTHHAAVKKFQLKQ